MDLSKLQEIIERYEKGAEFHKTQSENKEVSNVERNRHSYLHFHTLAFVKELKGIVENIKSYESDSIEFALYVLRTGYSLDADDKIIKSEGRDIFKFVSISEVYEEFKTLKNN